MNQMKTVTIIKLSLIADNCFYHLIIKTMQKIPKHKSNCDLFPQVPTKFFMKKQQAHTTTVLGTN